MNTICNSNRRAFVTTLVVLVVCLVIVTGSTFSLFTSQSGTNIAITSGKVEMVATINADSLELYSKGVEQKTGKFENGGTAGFNKESTKLTLTNVTPGDKVTFEIDVVNNSNVDIQYRVNWVVDGELAPALVATVNGETLLSSTSPWEKWLPSDPDTTSLSVSVELPLEAGDSYQNKTASIAFNVEAVQANATLNYDPTAYVNTINGLQDAIAEGATDIVLNDDVTSTEVIYFGDTENTVDLNGNKITSTGNFLFGAQGSNCVLTIEGDGEVETGSGYAAFASNSGTLKINNGSYQLGETNNKGSLFCQNSGTIVINDGEFISNDANTPILYCINGFIEINGGFFQNVANPNAALLSMGNNLNYINNQKITLRGGTFVNWNPMDSAFANAWTNPTVPALIVLADGYTVVSETQENGDIWYMVVPTP